MSKLVLTDGGDFTVDARDGLCVAPEDIERVTGWRVEAQGFCKEGVCVPLRGHARDNGCIDVAAFWRGLGHPVVSDEAGLTWVLGRSADARRDTMRSLEAPDFELPDVDGCAHRLSSLRGKKVLLVTWAPWCGCRTDLPVWQALHQELRDAAFAVLAVAQESGGAERVRPWVDAARAQYVCLVDSRHLVSDLFGLVNVPQAVWIDERGRIVRPPENPGWTDEWRHNAATLLGLSPERRKAHGFMSPEQSASRDAGRLAYMQAVKAWVRNGTYSLSNEEAQRRMPGVTHDMSEAHARFRLGVWLRLNGNAQEGDTQLARASALHPDSWAMWRQAAELDEIGKAVGTEFLTRLNALGDKPYYPPPDLPGHSSS